jgi:uncharacterized protein (TIGR03118 family)
VLVAPTTPGTYVYALECTNVTNGLVLDATAYLTVTKNGFSYTDLVANLTGTAARTVDASLEDPWGIAMQSRLAAATANRGTNTSTAYDGSGAPQLVGPGPAVSVVHLPAGAGGAPFNPTGVAATNTVFFEVTAAGKSGQLLLVYAGESGMLAAWSPAIDPANAINVYAANDGAIYRGLAIVGGLIYATDFHNGKVDVFNTAFAKQVHSSYPFADPALPAGYAPFGIAVGGSALYVTYAKRLAPANRDAMSGAGLGLVDEFDLAGNFVKRVVAPGGALNAPWGVALAPQFGDIDVFSGQLFVANTGDGRIHVFNPATGAFVGTVSDSTGEALTIPALHGIAFGNRYANQPNVSLFLTAGASSGTAGGYGRVDFGARPRFHAPPTIHVGVHTYLCVPFICWGVRVVYQVGASAADVTGIGRVELDTTIGSSGTRMAVFNSCPCYVSYYGPYYRRLPPPTSASVIATASDVDGNVGLLSYPF